MAITNGLITLAEARTSLGLKSTDTANDTDLERYIEAATPVIENITGKVLTASATYTFDGGRMSVNLPERPSAVTSVTESGSTITDYVADLTAGVVYAGTYLGSRYFVSGRQNIVIACTIGYAATEASVASNVKLATRELVRHLWQVGRQGIRPGYNSGAQESVIPQGFAVPRRVVELLEANPNLAGFA